MRPNFTLKQNLHKKYPANNLVANSCQDTSDNNTCSHIENRLSDIPDNSKNKKRLLHIKFFYKFKLLYNSM